MFWCTNIAVILAIFIILVVVFMFTSHAEDDFFGHPAPIIFTLLIIGFFGFLIYMISTMQLTPIILVLSIFAVVCTFALIAAALKACLCNDTANGLLIIIGIYFLVSIVFFCITYFKVNSIY